MRAAEPNTEKCQAITSPIITVAPSRTAVGDRLGREGWAIGGAAKLRLRILPMTASSGTTRTAAGVRQFTGNTLATRQQGLTGE